MTFQVGLVGADGVLIAGDTRWTHFPALRSNQFWAPGTHGTNSPKITINHERGIAASAARDMEVAIRIAHDVTAHLPEEQFVNPVAWIEEAAGQILSAARIERGDPDERIEAHCLVAIQRPVPKLFQFRFAMVNGQWGAYCHEMSRVAVAGDNVNGAIFWPESYYNSYPYVTTRLPIKALISLAAHTVTVAHRLNPMTISGLEIVFCDETGIYRLSEDSLQALQSAASAWDREFRETILSYSQEFSLDPSRSDAH